MQNFFIRITFYLLLLSSQNSLAQNAVFIKQGHIEFQERVNSYAYLEQLVNTDESESQSQSIIENYKQLYPQFISITSTLYFNEEKTLYQSPDIASTEMNWVKQYIPQNTVWNNLLNHQSISQKKLYEDAFLVSDSTREIQWKITDETREIAGFHCHRANAVIMDSVYVVAFYTDEIIPKGGPESFTGLPGMILGVVLPHDHITWFAVKVFSGDNTKQQLSPPTKGKPINNGELKMKIDEILKRFKGKINWVQKSILL